MDRPIQRALIHLPSDLLGPRVYEAAYPANLAEQFNAGIATVAAAPFPTVVCSWGIAGGGGGAGWRASFDVGLNPGWGLHTSPPARLAGMVCDLAQHSAEIQAVTYRLLESIPGDAFIWGIRHAASGRDGTYLVAILYTLQGWGSGKMTYELGSFQPLGPFNGEALVLQIALPPAVNGDPLLSKEYSVQFSMLLNDTSGNAGVFGRFKRDGSTVYESRITQPSTDWVSFAGSYYTDQGPSGRILQLWVEPSSEAQVSCRGLHMLCHLCNATGAES